MAGDQGWNADIIARNEEHDSPVHDVSDDELSSLLLLFTHSPFDSTDWNDKYWNIFMFSN